jgi:hypothetical protein
MGAGVILPPQRRARSPPYTGKVLREKADSWWHGLSPSSRQDRLESALLALKSLADAELGAALVLANLHHQRLIPLMERRPRIFETDETADPVALARSRLVHDRLPPEHATTRARRTINLKAVKNNNDALVVCYASRRSAGEWALPPFLYSSAMCRRDSDVSSFPAEGSRERRAVRPAHAPSLSARGAAAATGADGV